MCVCMCVFKYSGMFFTLVFSAHSQMFDLDLCEMMLGQFFSIVYLLK